MKNEFTEEKKEKKLITHLYWSSPNNVSWITKIFIMSISFLFITPLFLNFKYSIPYSTFKNWSYYKQIIDSIVIALKPLNDWTFGNFLFIIGYIILLFVLVNLRIYYQITNNGIRSYTLGGVKKISYYNWDNVSCYDIDEKNNKLLVWFNPPSFQHDWEVKIPKNKINEFNQIMITYVPLYSSVRNSNQNRNHRNFIDFTK